MHCYHFPDSLPEKTLLGIWWIQDNSSSGDPPGCSRSKGIRLELLSWRNVTSASTSDSSSEVELYVSSLNREADDIELKMGDVGRDTHGVKDLCGPGGSIGVVVSVLSAAVASGV